MTGRLTSMLATIVRLRADRSGATAAIFILTLVATIGSTALVLDVGTLLIARRELQASSDAAALAGASALGTGGSSMAAQTYSAVSGGANPVNNADVTMATGYPKVRCLTSINVPCTNSDAANAVVVKQDAIVPMTFGRILGFTGWRASATSTAALAGGSALPIEVIIVLDATASMNDSNSSCSVSGSTKLTCALAGGRALLSGMSPSSQRVGLMSFPGASTATEAKKNYDCSTSNPATVKYSANPVYQILGLGSDFRTTDKATTLDTNSNIVKALKGGASSCSQGMAAPGGFGTFYADAITAAQSALASNGRTGTQRVIILLSDGDANASSTNMTTAKKSNQCKQAVDAAKLARNAGTWVYSVAYGASTSATGSCGSDTVKISACDTMKAIASDPAKFYVGNSGATSACASSANQAKDLIDVFKNIGKTFKSSRLLPNNTA